MPGAGAGGADGDDQAIADGDAAIFKQQLMIVLGAHPAVTDQQICKLPHRGRDLSHVRS